LSYTQSPHLTEEEIENFLKTEKIARFCSLNKDNTIHATPVWFNYVNKNIIIGTPDTSRKARNVRRNKNVTVLVDRVEAPTQGVIIYGEVELTYDDIRSTAISIFERYMAKEQAETSVDGLMKIATFIIMKVSIKNVASFDYSKDTVYRQAVTYENLSI
jgi:nitroimidazol reductase NimA-like FMN-containing flavoprotein (pyridoxamine 5'-phosphate oxidase superfamily)